jgi:hypothetical protein
MNIIFWDAKPCSLLEESIAFIFEEPMRKPSKQVAEGVLS